MIPNVLKAFIKKYNKEVPAAITIDDIPERIKYEPNSGLPKVGLHIGQRKLALSEIQFLTEHPTSYVVYAGSSPSNKIYFISQLFPDTKFILIDPRKPEIFIDEERTVFDSNNKEIDESVKRKFMHLDYDAGGEEMVRVIRESPEVRIFMIKGFFNDALAGKLAPLEGNFISDIRSITERAEEGPRDIDVLWNLSQQYNWMRIMNPPVSCVKFRQVFYDPGAMEYFYEHYQEDLYRGTFEESKEFGIDFIEDYRNRVMRYPKGKVYLQAWAGLSSTETRLHVLRKDLDHIIDYNLNEYEDKMHFYNGFYRVYVPHKNEFTSDKLCLSSCNGCAIEATIWKNYITKVLKEKPTKDKVWKYVEKLGKYSKDLCINWHEDFNAKKIKEVMTDDLRRRQQKEGGNENMESTEKTNFHIMILLAMIVVIFILIMFLCGIPQNEHVIDPNGAVIGISPREVHMQIVDFS